MNELVECWDPALDKIMQEKKSFSLRANTMDDDIDNKENSNGESSAKKVVDEEFFKNRKSDEKLSYEDYKNFFGRKEMMKILDDSDDAKYGKNNDDDVIELDSSFVPKYWDRKPKLYQDIVTDSEEESSYDGFDPRDTSSLKLCNGLGPYIFRKFNRKHSRFPCEVHAVESPILVCINPLIDEFSNEFKKIQKSVEEVVGRAQRLENIKKGQGCLARNSDGKWYRGYIENISPSGLHANVIFVDIMSLHEIPRDLIKEIPETLLNIPLRCSRVELSGVQPNGRYREKLLTETLTKILVKEHKVMYAVIINFNSRYPKVKLYENEDCESLVYNQMILDQMFFL